MRFHIPGPALGYTISPDPSFPHAHAVMRVRACACTEGSGYQTKSDAADPGYSAAGRACQTERFARFCLRIDFARGCCYMD